MKRDAIRAWAWGMAVACLALLANAAVAGPVVIKINDVLNAPPDIRVEGAPYGYDIYRGPRVADPEVEDGALITLFGVDTDMTIPAMGWRTMDPRDPDTLPPLWADSDPTLNLRPYRLALDIIWIEHDPDTGDLRIGFNSALPGTWYWNPNIVGEEDLGPVVSNKWMTVYADDTVVVMFKTNKKLHVGKP